MKITRDLLLIGIPFLMLSATFIFLYIKKLLEYKKIYNKYKGIIDIEKEIEKVNISLKSSRKNFDKLDSELKDKTNTLQKEYQQKRSVYEKLLKEINILEEDMELISFGLYKPHYDFDASA